MDDGWIFLTGKVWGTIDPLKMGDTNLVIYGNKGTSACLIG